MISEVRVSMPIFLTPEMIRAVRDDPTTQTGDMDEWFTRLGWLICAYDVIVQLEIGGAK